MVPTSQAMQTIENIVTEIAPTYIPILLIGESGTGKEALARRIHSLSKQSRAPLAKITCACMTSDKLASELNGLLRGPNDVEWEKTGTLLFDELSDLDPACQRQLLHVLPDGEAVPRAGNIISRVISSTARDLEVEMQAARFRRELYYRINGICLRLPPLREHREDLPALADFLLAKHASQMGRLRRALGPKTLKVLMDYDWPGNIRELENVMRKIVALGNEDLAISELRSARSESARRGPSVSHDHSLKAAARAASRDAERRLIMEALARTHWNRKRAALELQVSYKSLLYKLKQIGIEEDGTN